jgi:hypothetical protein
MTGTSTATAAPPKLPAVTAPPRELGLDPFYSSKRKSQPPQKPEREE